MSTFAFSSFSYYKIVYSKFCYLIYLEQMNAAGSSAYSQRTAWVKIGYADLKEGSWPQTAIAKFCWLVIFIATQYITADHVRKDSLGRSAYPLHSKLLLTTFSPTPCYLTQVGPQAVLQPPQLLPDFFLSAQRQRLSATPHHRDAGNGQPLSPAEPTSPAQGHRQSENERHLCYGALQLDPVMPREAMRRPVCPSPSAHACARPPYSHQLSRAAAYSKSVHTFLHPPALDHRGTNMLPQLRGLMSTTLHTRWYRSFTPPKTQFPSQYNLQHLFS